MEFKQLETSAALNLIKSLEVEVRRLKGLASGITSEDEERKQMFATGWLMEANILQNGADQLFKDIENQNFDF